MNDISVHLNDLLFHISRSSITLHKVCQPAQRTHNERGKQVLLPLPSLL